MTDFPLNPILDAAILAKRQTLPLKVAPVTLTSKRFRLQPLDLAKDLALLFARSNGTAIQLGAREYPAYNADELIWRYMSDGEFADEAAMGAWLQAQIDAPDRLALAIYELESESPIGVMNLMSNSPQALSIELGNIWYSPIAQKTGANTEATYLALKHVFGLDYRRVIWKCDALNARSRKAALSMGFQFEGIHDYHLIVKNRNRDTAWFRILDKEWATVKAKLEARILSFTP